jgi:uncharacterized protein YggE
MKGNLKWGVTGLVVGLAAALTLPSLAQSPSPAAEGGADRTVSVSGSAIIRSAPDEAVVTLGVQTQGATAEAAMADNAERMSDVIKAILDEGIPEGGIATAWVNLWPNYSDSGLTIVGYTAENQVNVTVKEMGKIGRLIDQAVGAGANLTSGISFRVTDTNEGMDEALEAAVADARHKAEVLAAAGGTQLGSVIQITETGSPTPPPIYYDRALSAEAGAVPPIEAPTMETQVSVSVVWSLI